MCVLLGWLSPLFAIKHKKEWIDLFVCSFDLNDSKVISYFKGKTILFGFDDCTHFVLDKLVVRNNKNRNGEKDLSLAVLNSMCSW